MNTVASFLAAAVIGFAGSASAGDGIHAYNSGRDKVAQTALSTLTNLNLLTVISTANTNLETFQVQELALQDKQNAILRDLTLFAICTHPTDSVDHSLFTDVITNRFQILFGADEADPLALASKRAAALVNAKLLMTGIGISSNMFYARFKATLPAFSYWGPIASPPSEFWKATNANNAASFLQAFQAYARSCSNALFVVSDSLGSGELARAYTNAREAMATIDQLKIEAADLSGPIKTNSAQIDAALAAPSIETNFQTLTNALLKFKQAVDFVAQSTNAFAIVSAINTNQAAIDATIAAAVGAPPSTNLSHASPAVQRAVLIAGQLTPLANSTANLQKALNLPPISSLLIQKQLLSIQLDSANQNIDLQNKKVEILLRKFQAMELEVQMLDAVLQQRNALTSLATFNAAPPDWRQKHGVAATNEWSKGILAMPVPVLLDSSAPKEVKQPVVAALLNLALSIRVAQLREDQADLDLINLDYLSANAANETAVRMWNSLIAVPVNQLATYYGTGFKPAEVADLLIKALGLGAIAWRVH